jgi:hypothetical protein
LNAQKQFAFCVEQAAPAADTPRVWSTMAKPDLIATVADHLRRADVSFAVIGAAAMSARGFARQTFDLDILTTDTRVLAKEFWGPISPSADVRRGEDDDPLAGVIRFHDPELDIVVGRMRWQTEAVLRAETLTIGNDSLPVVTLGDLILLKLDAGGYRDAADIKALLSGAETGVVGHVESILARLDERAQRLWTEIRAASD